MTNPTTSLCKADGQSQWRSQFRTCSLIFLLCPIAACAPLNVTGGEPPVGWAPDQSDLLFSSNHEGNSEIYLRKAGAENFVNLTESEAQENWPVWSPDGERIAFQSRVDGNLDIVVMNADGTSKQRLTDNEAHDYVPTWSDDGEQIYFASWRLEEGETEPRVHFYVMNSDGSQQQRLDMDSPETSGPLEVSPDGNLFAYARRVGDGESVIRLRDRRSGFERELNTPSGYVGAPSFSPDGTKLAFYLQQGEISKIYTANISSGELNELVSSGRNWEPKWSPDGRWLLVTTSSTNEDRDLDFWLLRSDGTREPQLFIDTTGRTSEGRWRPSLSK